MVALRAGLLYTVIHFAAHTVDGALAARFAPYARWFDSRTARKRSRSRRPVHVRAFSKAALAFALRLLLDVTRRSSSAR